MQIKLMAIAGLQQALFGIGLSYGLTSGIEAPEGLSGAMKERLEEIAGRLACKGGGEDKFLRQVVYWWDVKAPRYWWTEADTYKVGTTAQSESTMHRLTSRPVVDEDFEDQPSPSALSYINSLIDRFNRVKCGDRDTFLLLKNALPEGYLQRRIWTVSLANMKNIYAQRRHHRLPQWHAVCEAFVEATPDFLLGMYRGKA